MRRNYAGTQHGEFREAFDAPFTAAHDLLADAYYGPESEPDGPRAGGWRDGVERVLLVGQTGYRLLAGAMERSTDGGQTWTLLAESPEQVFRKLEQVVHHRYVAAFGPALVFMGAKAEAAEAAGFDAAVVDAVVAEPDAVAVLQAVDVAVKAWDKGEAATLDVGGKTVAYDAVAVAEVPLEGGGLIEAPIEALPVEPIGKAEPSKADVATALVAVSKFAIAKQRAVSEAATSAATLSALRAAGWDLEIG